MKSILVHVRDDAGLEARLQAALDIARAFRGHLTCHSNIPFNGYTAISPFGSSYALTGLYEVMQELETKLQHRVEAQLANEDVSWSYVTATGFDDAELVSQSALNDLIVMSHSGDPKEANSVLSLVGRVLTSSHAPLLLVPESHLGFDVAGAALIGWNGSFEAGNVLRAAVPMLRHASSVTIVTVDDEPADIFPSTAASEYLSRHGISSELLNRVDHHASVEEVLLKTATELNAQYLVMGAFGHSRAREFWFGGVTRTMLHTSAIPLLMAH